MADDLRSGQARGRLDSALLDPPPTPTPAAPDDHRAPCGRGDTQDDSWLPPPPPLGSSRPERLVHRPQGEDSTRSRGGRSPSPAGGRSERRHSPRVCGEDVPLPPPPPLGSSRPERLVHRPQEEDSTRSRGGRSSSPAGGRSEQRYSPRGCGEDVPLPPPPPLGSSRPERLGHRWEVDSTRGRGEDLTLPPPPPLGSSQSERVIYRLECASPRDSRSSSPGGVLERAPPRRSLSRSDDREKVKRPRSPPRRSPSPLPPPPPPPPPPKRVRRNEEAGLLSPPRGGRHERGAGRDKFTGQRDPDVPDSAEYGASSNGHGIRKGLMTYKQFTQILEDDISPAEAESRYEEYRTSYITTQKRAYFDLHKDELWLKKKYHPTHLLSVIERRNEFCKAAAKNLILDLRSGTLDLGPGMTVGAASKSRNDSGGSSANAEDYGNKRRKNRSVLPEEPCPLSTAPEAHPVSSKYRRIQSDIDRTLALVKKLDAEKGIVGNILSTSDHGKSDVDRSHAGSMGPLVIVRGLATVKGLEGTELLDTLLTYLWRVHGVDYYGMSEMRDAQGFRHVRADNKSSSAFKISASDWEKKLDLFWHERLVNGEDPLVVLTAKDKIDAATNETLKPYVKKIMDETYSWKYGCGAKGCAKVFHTPEFVHKHLTLKHPDLVSVLTSRVQEDIYCQNYMNDPNAPGGIPVMQRSTPVPAAIRIYAPDRMRRIPDEQILGAYDVQGSNAPFVPEFPPPPLLIPVPGAGPLGPFVPAPPEMAIQMMLEQRPPRPNGARRGKVGSTPLLPLPMIPMYPHLQHDPRPLRRYNDLDTPEEEVTAIDYRSM